MLEPRIVAISVSRFAEAVAPVDLGEAEAANGATLRLAASGRSATAMRHAEATTVNAYQRGSY